MAKKKNRSEPDEGEPLTGPPSPAPEAAAEESAASPSPPPDAAAAPPAPPAPAAATLASEPTPPAPPAPDHAPASHFELVLGGPPVAPPAAPVAVVTAEALGPLEERIRNLEGLLVQLQQVHAQQLAAAQASPPAAQTQTQTAPTPETSSGPSVLGQARALLNVGRTLLPHLPPGVAPPPARRWLIWEMIAEVRAMIYMYVDPRYRLSWTGYVLPPLLFVAYLLSYYWVPFTSLLDGMKLSRLLTVPVDVLLLYSMFKILGREARRYRETAPDLPPSLRL